MAVDFRPVYEGALPARSLHLPSPSPGGQRTGTVTTPRSAGAVQAAQAVRERMSRALARTEEATIATQLSNQLSLLGLQTQQQLTPRSALIGRSSTSAHTTPPASRTSTDAPLRSPQPAATAVSPSPRHGGLPRAQAPAQHASPARPLQFTPRGSRPPVPAAHPPHLHLSLLAMANAQGPGSPLSASLAQPTPTLVRRSSLLSPAKPGAAAPSAVADLPSARGARATGAGGATGITPPGCEPHADACQPPVKAGAKQPLEPAAALERQGKQQHEFPAAVEGERQGGAECAAAGLDVQVSDQRRARPVVPGLRLSVAR